MNFNYFNVKNLYNKFVKKIRGGQQNNINKTNITTTNTPEINESVSINEPIADNSQFPTPVVDVDQYTNLPSQEETLVNDSQNGFQNPTFEETLSQQVDVDNSGAHETQPSENSGNEFSEPVPDAEPEPESTLQTRDSTTLVTPSSQFDAEESLPIDSTNTTQDESTYQSETSDDAEPESNAESTTLVTPSSQFDADESLPVETEYAETNTESTEATDESTHSGIIIPELIPNIQNEPYYDSIPYHANNKTYNYLNRDNLKTTFTGLTDRNTNPYTIYLCAYTMILNQYLPFYQYWLINRDSFYQFPSFEFVLPLHPMNPEIANDNQMPDDDLFSSAYETELKKYYGENIPKFKGFVENGNTIYVILEENNTPLLDEYKSVFKPAVLHEMLNLRKICNVDIHESACNLFKYEYIADIYDETDKVVEYPYLLYLCEGTEGSYSNLENIENVEVFIPNRILHSALGYCYLFTSKMLNESASNTKRFVVFIENTLYILNKSVTTMDYHLFDNADIDENPSDPDSRNYQYSSIYFWEGNTQLWALYSSKYLCVL